VWYVRLAFSWLWFNVNTRVSENGLNETQICNINYETGQNGNLESTWIGNSRNFSDGTEKSAKNFVEPRWDRKLRRTDIIAEIERMERGNCVAGFSLAVSMRGRIPRISETDDFSFIPSGYSKNARLPHTYYTLNADQPGNDGIAQSRIHLLHDNIRSLAACFLVKRDQGVLQRKCRGGAVIHGGDTVFCIAIGAHAKKTCTRVARCSRRCS